MSVVARAEDGTEVECGGAMAECHRMVRAAVSLLLLRRCLDGVGAVLRGAKGGVVLRASTGRWREEVGNP